MTPQIDQMRDEHNRLALTLAAVKASKGAPRE